MTKKINSLLHITHNDSDAVGCALVDGFIFPSRTLDKKARVYVAAGAEYADKVILAELFHSKFSSIKEARECIRKEQENFGYSYYHNYDMLLISDHDVSIEMADFLNEYMSSTINTEHEFHVFLIDHHSHKLINELYDKYDWIYLTRDKHQSACSFMLSKYVSSVLFQYSQIEENHFVGYDEYKCLEILIRLIAFYDTFSYKDDPVLYDDYLNIFRGSSVIYKADYIANVIHYKDNVSVVVDELESYYFQYFDENYNHKTEFGSDFVKKKIMPFDFHYINQSIIPTVYRKNLKDIEKKAKVVNFNAFGETCRCVIFLSCRGDNISDSCYDIIKRYPAISMAMVIFPESEEISLRSDGTIDVSKVACSLKGGGHPKAAGFHANTEVMLYLINSYYHGEELTKYVKI